MRDAKRQDGRRKPTAQWLTRGSVRDRRGQAIALLFNLPVWGLLIPITLMWFRMRLERLSERVEQMKAAILEG